MVSHSGAPGHRNPVLVSRSKTGGKRPSLRPVGTRLSSTPQVDCSANFGDSDDEDDLSPVSKIASVNVDSQSPGPSPGRSCSGDDSVMSDRSDCREESFPVAESASQSSQSSQSSNEMESSDKEEVSRDTDEDRSSHSPTASASSQDTQNETILHNNLTYEYDVGSPVPTPKLETDLDLPPTAPSPPAYWVDDSNPLTSNGLRLLPGSSAFGSNFAPNTVEYGPDNRAPTPSLDDSGYSGPSSSPHDHWQGNTNLNIQMGANANANANDASLRYPTPERSEAGSPRVLSRSISRKDKNTTMKRRRNGSDEDNDNEDEDEDNQNTAKRSRFHHDHEAYDCPHFAADSAEGMICRAACERGACRQPLEW